jgi:hypothetical protein
MEERSVWNSHNWQTRKVEISANELIHYHCSRCSRDFVDDQSTGKRYAVHVAIFRFEELPGLITARWLVEFCPGVPLVQDVAVRKRPATI